MPGNDPNISRRRRDRIGRFADEPATAPPRSPAASHLEQARANYSTEIERNALKLSSMRDDPDITTRTIANDDGELMTFSTTGPDIFGITENGRDFPDDIAVDTTTGTSDFTSPDAKRDEPARRAECACMEATQGADAAETTPQETRNTIGELHQRYMNAVNADLHTNSDKDMRIRASVDATTGQLNLTPAWELRGDWPETRLVPLNPGQPPTDENHIPTVTVNPGNLDNALAGMGKDSPIRVGTGEDSLHVAQASENSSHQPMIVWFSLRGEDASTTV